MSPNLTQDQAFTAMRTFLLAILPSGTEVVQGQANRVPMPRAGNFVTMYPVRRQMLEQTTHDYTPPVNPVPAIGSQDVGRMTALHMQFDVYGDMAAENAQVITDLFRDAYGVAGLAGTGIVPLSCEDPAQMPLLTGEQQYLQRWMVRLAVQANLIVTVPQEFADTLITTLVESD